MQDRLSRQLDKEEQSYIILGAETVLVLFPVFNKQTASSLGPQCQIKILNKLGHDKLGHVPSVLCFTCKMETVSLIR